MTACRVRRSYQRGLKWSGGDGKSDRQQGRMIRLRFGFRCFNFGSVELKTNLDLDLDVSVGVSGLPARTNSVLPTDACRHVRNEDRQEQRLFSCKGLNFLPHALVFAPAPGNTTSPHPNPTLARFALLLDPQVLLHRMISNAGSDVVRWTSDGNVEGFEVLNVKKLEKLHIPLFFRHCKVSRREDRGGGHPSNPQTDPKPRTSS